MVRFKNRYFLFEVIYDTALPPYSSSPSQPLTDGVDYRRVPTAKQRAITQRHVQEAVRASIALHFGDFGTGLSAGSLHVKYFNAWTGLGILRAPRDIHQLVWASMTFLRSLEGQGCLFRVHHVSGTIRNCQQKAIELDEFILCLYKKAGRSADIALRRLQPDYEEQWKTSRLSLHQLDP